MPYMYLASPTARKFVHEVREAETHIEIQKKRIYKEPEDSG